MDWVMWLLLLAVAFWFGRQSKAYPSEEEMLQHLIKQRTDKKLLEMTREVLVAEINKVSTKLAQR